MNPLRCPRRRRIRLADREQLDATAQLGHRGSTTSILPSAFPRRHRFRGECQICSIRDHDGQSSLLAIHGATQLPALSQIAPDWVIPAEPCDLAAGPGELVIEVDDREHRQPVFLPEGMSHASARVAIETRAGVG